MGPCYHVLLYGMDMTNGALDDALEAGVRPRIKGRRLDFRTFARLQQRHRYNATQLLKINVARAHYRRCVGIVSQRKQKVLGRRAVATPGDSQCAVDRLMKIWGEGGHPGLINSRKRPFVEMAIRPGGSKTRNTS